MSNEITRNSEHTAYLKGDNRFPPVSTILSFLDEDTTGLEIYRDRNDGVGDSAHWPHHLWYSRHRGTLSHYEALNPLADRELWGADERDSMEQILTGPSESDMKEVAEMVGPDEEIPDVSLDMEDIVYSVMERHEKKYPYRRTDYDGDTLLSEVLYDDVDYFVDNFRRLRDGLGITQDAVIGVEQYLVNSEDGYGGQADLLYEDPSGNVVMADLKTSSSLRHKHRLQTAAYKRGVEVCDAIPVENVNRLEVIRISADKEDVAVHSHERPAHVPADAEWFDTDEFLEDPYGDFEYEDIDGLWAKFASLVDKHNTVTGDQ
jgi:hypothetical protein